MISVPNSQPLSFSLENDPQRTALLMIDFQSDFCDSSKNFLGALNAPAEHTFASLGPASAVLHAARKAKIRIIHTLESHLCDLSDLSESKDRRSRLDPSEAVIGTDRGNGRILVRGSPCNGIMPQVAFQDGEIAIHKPGKGAFYGTELMARLDGVTQLIFCGVTTEVCVQSTMREANDRGFDSLLVVDATASCVPAFKTQAIEQLTAFGAIVGCSAESADVVSALENLARQHTTTVPDAIPPVMPQLPVIDVSPLVKKLGQPFAARSAADAECLQCAQKIDQACRRVGFFYISGHGIDVDSIQACAKEFFALPFDSKMKLQAQAGEGAGYEPSGAQVLDEGRLGEGIDGSSIATKAGDLKESYIVGKSAPSQRVNHNEPIEGRWPDEACIPEFKQTLIKYHDAVEELLRTLLRGIGLGLGLAADTFDCFTKDAMTKVRLLRYPANDDKSYGAAWGCGAHTDWGALTLLQQDEVGGLEVCCETDGHEPEWVAAPNIEGALLVNVGDMLKLWTSGRYRSTPHRVVKPMLDNQARYAIATFYNCDHDAPIDPRLLCPNKEVPLDRPVITAEEYILERVKATYSK